jgi:hypothetical protein
LNYQVYVKKLKEDLLKNDVGVYGLTLFGDGATVKRMPLINILAGGVHNQSGGAQYCELYGSCPEWR